MPILNTHKHKCPQIGPIYIIYTFNIQSIHPSMHSSIYLAPLLQRSEVLSIINTPNSCTQTLYAHLWVCVHIMFVYTCACMYVCRYDDYELLPLRISLMSHS